MAALNQRETESLSDACKAIQYVLRNGYDPKKAAENDPQAVYTKNVLEAVNKAVNTVKQMKGYYPS